MLHIPWIDFLFLATNAAALWFAGAAVGKYISKISEGHLDEYDKKHLMTIMRKNIEQHKDVRDLDTLSVLIFKGEHSFQEAAMLWKTRSHVLDYFAEIKQDKRNYLERFFANEPYASEEENDAAMEEMWQEVYAEAKKSRDAQKQGKPYTPSYILTEHYFGRNPALDKHQRAPFF